MDTACALLGGRVKLAEKLGVERTAIGNWKTRGIPAEHCQEILRLTSGRVTLQQMRPNDWHKYWPELAVSRVDVTAVNSPGCEFTARQGG